MKLSIKRKSSSLQEHNLLEWSFAPDQYFPIAKSLQRCTFSRWGRAVRNVHSSHRNPSRILTLYICKFSISSQNDMEHTRVRFRDTTIGRAEKVGMKSS